MKLFEKLSIISRQEMKPLNYIKSLFTWKGRDIALLKDENFLSLKDWKHNLKLLAEFTAVTPTASLMNKEIYQWLPENSCISEGYSNLKERFQELSSESYARWLTIGPLIGITFLFFKAIRYNLNCLDEFEIVTDDVVGECRNHFAELLKQPGNIARVAVAGGAWAFAGWLIKTFG